MGSGLHHSFCDAEREGGRVQKQNQEQFDNVYQRCTVHRLSHINSHKFQQVFCLICGLFFQFLTIFDLFEPFQNKTKLLHYQNLDSGPKLSGRECPKLTCMAGHVTIWSNCVHSSSRFKIWGPSMMSQESFTPENGEASELPNLKSSPLPKRASLFMHA